MGALTAVCLFLGALKGSQIILQQVGDEVHVATKLTGVSVGLHGFHIHEKGDLGEACVNAGGHYNPDNVVHGDPATTEPHHRGDLGNINVTSDAETLNNATYKFFTLSEVIGRAFVVHADEDDLGYGNETDSNSTGHAGARLDCCVIGIVDGDALQTCSDNMSVVNKEPLWLILLLAFYSVVKDFEI